MEQRELLKKKIADDEQKVIDEELKRQNSTSFKIKLACANFVDSNPIQVLMTLVTIYALLGDDLKLLTTTIEADIYFTWCTSIALVLFMLELILASIGKEGYLNSFFYWLDLVSTLSLVTDIPPIWNKIIGDEPSAPIEADSDNSKAKDGKGGDKGDNK